MAESNLLDECLELSQRMLNLSEQDDWESIVDLEVRRREKLNRVFSRRPTLSERDVGRVRDILAVDKTLIERGTVARDAVAEEISRMQLGRKVSQAYRSVED
jgi:hypothetical protein